MLLTSDQEELEHTLRVEQMQTNIEKMRADIRMEERKLTRQTYGIVIQVVGLVIAAFAAGAAWMRFFGH
jgi:hypothetical protein